MPWMYARKSSAMSQLGRPTLLSLMGRQRCSESSQNVLSMRIFTASASAAHIAAKDASPWIKASRSALCNETRYQTALYST